MKLPCEYRIENGMAVVDEAGATAVREFYDCYISGLALMAAAKKVGLKPFCVTAKIPPAMQGEGDL
ncbi:MAG: hypothetical protein Q4E91_14000 [Lachnospiraceae bacterium]|nr:hypothetical protein [Lachnospiraceae bacterium]